MKATLSLQKPATVWQQGSVSPALSADVKGLKADNQEVPCLPSSLLMASTLAALTWPASEIAFLYEVHRLCYVGLGSIRHGSPCFEHNPVVAWTVNKDNTVTPRHVKRAGFPSTSLPWPQTCQPPLSCHK